MRRIQQSHPRRAVRALSSRHHPLWTLPVPEADRGRPRVSRGSTFPILAWGVVSCIAEILFVGSDPERAIHSDGITQLLRQVLSAVCEHFRGFVHRCKTPV